jgi:hypothetical protein
MGRFHLWRVFKLGGRRGSSRRTWCSAPPVRQNARLLAQNGRRRVHSHRLLVFYNDDLATKVFGGYSMVRRSDVDRRHHPPRPRPSSLTASLPHFAPMSQRVLSAEQEFLAFRTPQRLTADYPSTFGLSAPNGGPFLEIAGELEQHQPMAANSAFKRRVYLYSTALLICTVLLSLIFFPPDGSAPKRWSVQFDRNNPWHIRKIKMPFGSHQEPKIITIWTIGPVNIFYFGHDSRVTKE